MDKKRKRCKKIYAVKLTFIFALLLIMVTFYHSVIVNNIGHNEERKPALVETLETTGVTAGTATLNGKLTEIGDHNSVNVYFKILNTERELIGDLVLEKRVIGDIIEEGDGLSAADIDGDGDLDPIVGTGDGGSVYWLKKRNQTDWSRHLITEGLIEVEGTSAADFDGDGRMEIIIFDQATANPDAPNVYIAKQDTPDPMDGWSLAVLDENAPHVQQGLVFDVDADGDLDLVYAYEGKVDGEGGFYWMEYRGGDVLDSSNWEKYEIDQIEGAWWIDYNSPKDWGGLGNGDIAVGVRAGGRSPPSALGGVFIYTQPSDPTEEWNRMIVDDDFPVLQVASGNFTGSGEKDLVAGACHDSADSGLYIYEYDNQWNRIEVESGHDWWGTYAYDIDNDGMFEIISGDRTTKKMNVYAYDGDSGRYKKEATTTFEKPDDQIIFADIDGDGISTEFFVGSDVESILVWFLTYDMDESNWEESDHMNMIKTGEFNITIEGIEPDTNYVFKAVVTETDTGNILCEGDLCEFTTDPKLEQD